jgi:uncharacterized FlaG/YvyC family protein
MKISAVASVNNGTNYNEAPVSTTLQGVQPQSDSSIEHQPVGRIKNSSTNGKEQMEKELTYDEARKETKEMNKFMKLLNADIRFILHEKTSTKGISTP